MLEDKRETEEKEGKRSKKVVAENRNKNRSEQIRGHKKNGGDDCR